MQRRNFVGVSALLLAACGEVTTPERNVTNGVGTATNTAQFQAESPPAAKPVLIASKTEALEFSYGWPAEAAAIPELDAWLRGNAAKLKAEAEATAKEDKASAVSDDYAFNRHTYSEDWKTLADTPRLLVLASEGYTFTGGAHGMPITTVVMWDRQIGKRIATTALFDVPALARVTKPAYCAELDRQRAEKRGGEAQEEGGIEEFSQCVPMQSYALIPMAEKGKPIDRIRVAIPPYEAGPYAEGTYEIDLPVTSAILATVKPDYRAAFGTP